MMVKKNMTVIMFYYKDLKGLLGERVLKKIIKPIVYTSILAVLCLQPCAFAKENNFVNTLAKPFSAVKNAVSSTASKLSEKSVQKKKNKAEKNAVNKANTAAETPVAIQGGIVYSLEDCVNFAMKNDPNIQIYKGKQQVQKNNVGIAKSNYFPTFYGGTGYNLNYSKMSGDMSNSTNNNYYGLDAGINQLIWDFGRTNAKINMNKYNFEAAGYDLENVTLNSIYGVKIYYASVLAARANVDIDERSVRINQLNVDRTKAMYEVGLKSKIDVVNAQVNLTDARIILLQAQNTYQTALINLNNAMYYTDAPDYAIKDTETFNFQNNYSVRNEIDVAYNRKNYNPNGVDAQIKDGAILTSGIEKRDILKTYKFKPYGLSMADSIKKAYENRPDIKSLELVKKASEESLKAIKRSYMPSINASAGYSLNAKSDYSSNAVAVYAGIDLPTINAMGIKNQIEQGKAYLDIADKNVGLLKKNVYFQVQNYYVNMKQLEKRIPLMTEKVSQTLENFELADGRYAVGLGNYIELQQALTNYNNAQLAFVQSVFDYNQARYYLEKSMGIR
jgi:outer membrane protein